MCCGGIRMSGSWRTTCTSTWCSTGTHATLAAVAPDLADRVLTVSGVSKTYAMTGWRIGFAAGPRDLIKAMVNMQGQVSAGVSTVGQAAAAAALDGPQDEVASDAGRVSAPAGHGGRGAEPRAGDPVSPAGGRVLRLSQRRRAAGQDDGGRADAGQRRGCRAGACWRRSTWRWCTGRRSACRRTCASATRPSDAPLAEACERIVAFCSALR